MPSDLRSAIAARNRADRKDAILHFVLAAPFTLFGLGLANVFGLLLWYVLWTFGIPIGVWTYLGGFNILLLVMIIVDLRRAPDESWHQPTYRLAGGGVRGHEIGMMPGDTPEGLFVNWELERSKGIFSGMPLMTNMSDPHNLAERGRVLSNGFANLILGGPRSIRKGMAILRWNSVRSRPRTVQAAERFMAWLGSRVVTEPEIKARLEAHPDEAEGLALAREVEVLTRRRIQEEFHYQRR